MQQHLQNKKGLVQGVFNQVFDKYDLMNDFMSFGIHRLWKKNLINMMGPSKNKSLVDVACGTGDIGKLYLDKTNINNHITCIDPNKGMVTKGKEKLKNYGISPPSNEVVCPQCNSKNTDIISEFGATACKSMHKCLDCLEPFEHFKCI